MIEYREHPDSDIVEFVIDGKVTRAEFDEAAAKFQASVEKHGKVRVLEDVRGFSGIDPSAVWEDIKFAWRHRRDIRRAAVVGDQSWVQAWARLAGPFAPCPVKYFDRSDMAAAWEWLGRNE